MQTELPLSSSCLRCQVPLRPGTPDPKARGIRQTAGVGYCANCMITRFLLAIEPVRNIIEGSPARGSAAAGVMVPARPGQGPEILFGGPFLETLRPVIASVLAHTQLPEDQIDWVEVVSNWGIPWPKGREPKVGDV